MTRLFLYFFKIIPKPLKISGKILKNALKRLDITQSKAALMLGVSRQTVVTWTGKSELDDETCKLIAEKLNIDLTKFNDDPHIVKPEGVVTSMSMNKKKSTALVPFYNADFIAGTAELYYEDATIYPDYYIDIPDFAGCIAFRAFGDSMEKIIPSGSTLFGSKLDDWRSHLEFGKIYGVVCTDGRRYLKYIRRSNDPKNYFILKSENPTHDDMDMPIDKIKNLWLIEGYIVQKS